MCHTSSRSGASRAASNKPMLVSAAPRLARTITRRRSQRSAATPAKGATSIGGRVADTAISENLVADPVRRKTQTPRVKAVRLEPNIDTACPSQSRKKFLDPPLLFASLTTSSPPDAPVETKVEGQVSALLSAIIYSSLDA